MVVMGVSVSFVYSDIPLWSKHYHWHIRCVSHCVLLQPHIAFACPCNYIHICSAFSISLSHTHPSLPPLCQPGNAGQPQPFSLPSLSSPSPFINRIPLAHWIPTLLDVSPMLPACLCLSRIFFCHNCCEAAAKVMMPLLWGKYSLWRWKCLLLLLHECNNL